MDAAAGPPRFTVPALARFLLAPDAGEQLSPVGGDGATGPAGLVLDLRASTEAEAADAHDVLADQLAILPCVTIAIESGVDSASLSALADACDVRVASEGALAPIEATLARTPIAAVAYAQLLRAAPRRSVYEGLVAESFVYSTLQAGAEFGAWLDARRKRRKQVRAEVDPPVRMDRVRDQLEIHLTRAAKHNAFSRAMRDGLSEALQLALADPSIDEVILSGEGPSFCSGGDLDEFGSFPDPAAAHAIRTTRSPALLLSRLADRVRVEVHGACIGAGVELPAFTSRVIADEDAFFQLPEVALGLVPGAGGTASLPRRIGRQRTAWLGLSAERIDARTALAWGLVDEVRLGQHSESASHDANGERNR